MKAHWAFTFAIVGCGGGGQDVHANATPTASASAAVVSREDHCRDVARACGDALVSGIDEKIIDCMADEAIAFVGGRDNVARELASGKVNMAKEGWGFEHADIDAPREIVSGGKQYFAVLPQRVTLKSPKGRLLQRGYLLGVSNDGSAWKFIDGAGITDKNIKQMYPAFPASIVLPALTKPELLP